MRQLVIDCATEAYSVALFEDEQLIAGNFEMLGRGHAEKLVPMIAALPDKGKADHIAVNIGPGSFTGIRVGLAAAKALALAWDSKLVGYETPSLIAAIARQQNGSAKAVDVALTGGHGEWFFQSFDSEGTASNQVLSVPPETAAQISSADIFAGSQAEALRALRGVGTAMTIWPDAREFHLLSDAVLIANPSPSYGRAPDAKLPSRK